MAIKKKNLQNALMHYGVMGMHWGVSKGSDSSGSEDHRVAAGLKKKKLHEMSNAELKTLTSRMQLEKQYKDLSPKKLSAGKAILNATLGTFGKTAASTVAVGLGTAAGGYALKRILGK